VLSVDAANGLEESDEDNNSSAGLTVLVE